MNSTEGKENNVGLSGAGADSCAGETSHLAGDERIWGRCPSHGPLEPGLDAAPGPPEGNKKGVCSPDLNCTGNQGIALLLAGERGDFYILNKAAPMSEVPQ